MPMSETDSNFTCAQAYQQPVSLKCWRKPVESSSNFLFFFSVAWLVQPSENPILKVKSCSSIFLLYDLSPHTLATFKMALHCSFSLIFLQHVLLNTPHALPPIMISTYPNFSNYTGHPVLFLTYL